MSSVSAAERRQAVMNRNGGGLKKKKPPIPCISRSLYETPPRSNFFPLQLFYKMLHKTFAILSKFVLGQFIITVFDYNMIKLERTLDFCVPQRMSASDIAEHHRNILTVVDRPLTWIFFIPALIALRVIRFYLSAASIIMGRGEVTAKQMQMKIVGFRRYYRSIRHYAVKKYTPIELMLKTSRCNRWRIWRVIYRAYEFVVMTKPPVAHHANMPDEDDSSEEQTDKNYRNGNSASVKKNSLNDIDDSSDDDLNTNEMLDEYAKLEDTSADPDYVPHSGDESSGEETASIDEVDTEEEKTESRQKLNSLNDTSCFSGDFSEAPQTSPVRDTLNGYASDIDPREKSKNETQLDEQQLKDLENQLVMKIMKHFKDNFNYPPSNGPTSFDDENFYSPIGSPPEKGYNSDPEISSTNGFLNHSENVNQIQEISSSENSPKENGDQAAKTQKIKTP